MALISWAVTKSANSRLIRPIAYFHRMLTNSKNTEAVQETPVKYTTSKAASWTARDSRGDFKDDTPSCELYLVLSSVTVFMIYFCVLREENDIDAEMNKTLYERIPGLEKKQLELALSYNETNGLDSTDIKKRLEEIKMEETN